MCRSLPQTLTASTFSSTSLGPIVALEISRSSMLNFSGP